MQRVSRIVSIIVSKKSFKGNVKNSVKGSVKKELTCASPFSASPSDAMDSSNLSLHAILLLNCFTGLLHRLVQGPTQDCTHLSVVEGMCFIESNE